MGNGTANTGEEIRVTPWIAFGHHGATHYRIWTRVSAFQQAQRHEWKLEDGTADMDDWLSCPRLGFARDQIAESTP